MKTATYPAIGQKVEYVRQGADGEIETGKARILALTLDPDKRLVAHLDKEAMEGSEKFNVDVGCLNPSNGFIERFTAATKMVLELSGEGNGKVQEIVAEYNEKVNQAYTGVLGKPLIFEN